MKKMGPNETTVRATLRTRPASILYLDGENRETDQPMLAGLFTALAKSCDPKRRSFVGKAECEWDWEEFGPP